MDAQRWQIVSQARRGTGIAMLQVADQQPQAALRIIGVDCLLERCPVRPLDLLALLSMPFRQLGQDVAQLVHGAPATVCLGPCLVDGRDQAWCPVGDNQPRTAQATLGEISTEVQSVLARLPLAEADPLRAELSS